MIKRQPGEPLGIRINGGLDGKRLNPDDPEDDGIFVTEVRFRLRISNRFEWVLFRSKRKVLLPVFSAWERVFSR